MNLMIWGAEAIGGTIGAYLVRAGHQVTLVDRAQDHVEAIHTLGLRITGPIDEFAVRVPAYTPDAISDEHKKCLTGVGESRVSNKLAFQTSMC